MRVKKTTRMTKKKTARVYRKSFTASLFLPSRYHNIGLPKTRVAVIVAENTNSISIMMGASIVCDSSINRRGALNNTETRTAIYEAVAKALNTAYFQISFFIRKVYQ